ncbi:hypothetical protein KIV66_gp37 [Mycobacterium phage MyraDee]|uniref:Uncharacterized protein n=1 Tax=Mycobacterium phage MyraDee TaxID=2024303 RepID=A0A222Z0R2_9CAUD|nr:hypothetical protein KIV66_gp37 [Mycobacterium phage MyraDee]ASR77145.1 hypothetical protein SEA_MYRADEE_37 [Mycobacterium phage MyraDee]
MEDREFFDHIYQVWSKTTGAKDKFWMPEEYTDRSGRWKVYAVDDEQQRTLIAEGMNEPDSDWLTAAHGCFGDLIRRLGDALDEADRLDAEKDELIAIHAGLEMEIDELHSRIEALGG